MMRAGPPPPPEEKEDESWRKKCYVEEDDIWLSYPVERLDSQTKKDEFRRIQKTLVEDHGITRFKEFEILRYYHGMDYNY